MTADAAAAQADQRVDDNAIVERPVKCASCRWREVIVGTHRHAVAAVIAHDSAHHTARAVIGS